MALTDLTRISTSGIATGTSLSGAILHGDAHFRGTQIGVTSALFDSSDNALEFNDNVKIKLGNSGDLNIFHNGTNSIIQDSGQGNLELWGENVAIRNANGGEVLAGFTYNGSVDLFYNNYKKFETTQTGAVVTGILTATGFSGPLSNSSGISTFYDLRVTNNLTVEGSTTTLDTNLIGVDRVEVGANSNSIVGVAVTHSGTADLVNLFDGATKVVTVDDVGNVGLGSAIPSVKLDVNGTSKFQDDVTFTGTYYNGWLWDKSADSIQLKDNTRLLMGSGGTDFNMRHDGTYNWIQNQRSYPLLIDGGSGGVAVISGANYAGGKCAQFIHNGAVELYWDNSKKLETSSSGAETTGGLLVDTVDPVLNVGSAYAYKYGYFGDADKHALTVRGNEASLEVFASEQSYHAGSIILRGGNEGFGFVNNSTNDRLELISFTASANSFAIHNNGANLSNYNKVFVANKNGSIDLYHSGSKKFETTSSGVKFTGVLEAIDNQSILLGTSQDFRIRHTGSNSEITDEGTGKLRLGSNTTEIRSADLSVIQAQFVSGGAVNLYHNNNKRLETTSSGVEITGTNILLNDDSAITGTANSYLYGRGTGSTAGLSLYGAESAIEIVSNDDNTHGGSLLFRTVTDGAGFVYNGTDNALELKLFTPSGNNFAIHGAGNNVTMDTQLRVVKDGAVELNHNGSKRFETTAGGTYVTGILDTTGNVNIGMSGESTRLAVKGISGALSVDSRANISLFTGATDGASATGTGILFFNHSGGGQFFGGSLQVIKENSGNGNTDSLMRFATRANGGNVTERMRITSGGTLGINLLSPDTSFRLDCSGAAQFTTSTTNQQNDFLPGQLTVRNNQSAQGAFIDFRADSATGVQGVIAKIGGFNTSSGSGYDGLLTFSTRQNSSNTMIERMRINNLGRVFINSVGPTTPTADYRSLNIVASGSSADEAGISFSRSHTVMGSGSTAGKSIILLPDGSLSVQTHNVGERMRVDSSGRVVVGGTSAYIGGAALAVLGTGTTPNTYGSFAIGKVGANPTSGTTLANIRLNGGSVGTRRGAEINAIANGNWTDGSSHPTKLTFAVANVNSTSATERYQINHYGHHIFTNENVFASSPGTNSFKGLSQHGYQHWGQRQYYSGQVNLSQNGYFDLFSNNTAHDDIIFWLNIKGFHGNRTFATAHGAIGGYGLSVSYQSASGVYGAFSGVDHAGTGGSRRRLRWTSTSPYAANWWIWGWFSGTSATTTHTGYAAAQNF